LDHKGAPIEQKRIAYELMALVGGEKGIAEKIMAEYEATAPGSIARARFYELCLKLFREASPKELSGDLDYISEEDIARALREQISYSEIQLGYPTHVCMISAR